MATYTKYHRFIENLCNKLIDAFGTTDTWKAVIHTDAPVPTTDNVVGDLTQIGSGTGYTTGGNDITFNSTITTGTVTATATDVVWTGTGAGFSGRYFSIYDDTSALDNLLCSYDYASTFTVASGETMTLDFGASLFTIA